MSDIYEQLEAWEAECDCLKNRIKQLEAENARQASAAQILADMNVSLDKENARLRAAMASIVAVGHNDDCIFCGLKDKQAVETIK